VTRDLTRLIERAEGLLARVEALLPPAEPDPDWKKITAARWRKRGGRGFLHGVAHPHAISQDQLVAVDAQKRLIDQNTRQFVAGLPANNVLLTGSRGTGKSSLVKAMLARYASKGLRLIEVDKADLADLPDIVERIQHAAHRFVIFCDDLTFDAGEAGYKALKVALDGSIAGTAGNVLIYATSNRRHLLPETMAENLETKHVGDEVHPGESVEEKISLSERFGVWISFYPFTQDDYIAAVRQWLAAYGVRLPLHDDAAMLRDALQFALGRGSRSGRVASQFARHMAGARGIAGARGTAAGTTRATSAKRRT
jgi:predicted AAA+ superfamily ATPase